MDGNKLNDVVTFVLDNKFELTALELLHELIDNGFEDNVAQLKAYFSDEERFPPAELLKFQTAQAEDSESISEDPSQVDESISAASVEANKEKRQINFAIKDYLVRAGYSNIARKFSEEVPKNEFEEWKDDDENGPLLQILYRSFFSQPLETQKHEDAKNLLERQLEDSEKTFADLRNKVEQQSSELQSLRAALLEKEKELITATKELEATKVELQKRSLQNQPSEPSENTAAPSDALCNGTDSLPAKTEDEEALKKKAVDALAVDVIANSLPNIIPNVLINKRDEVLPLLLCAIEHHPSSAVRVSLTHSLFNLIKRPDEDQRAMIMGACKQLAEKLGQQRTFEELMPQCWDQIGHKLPERRILVAQCCGQLAGFVDPSLRSTLILSSLDQLRDDSSPAVRQQVVQNLAVMMPLMPEPEKYAKLEDLLLSLSLDPDASVVEDCLSVLLPALVTWMASNAHPLFELLSTLLNRLSAALQRCPPVSGVEGLPESRLRVVGERERWATDALLRLLTALLPHVRQAVVAACPAALAESETGDPLASPAVLGRYLAGSPEWSWPELDWLVAQCLPAVISLATLLSPREEALRQRTAQLLKGISDHFGGQVAFLLVLPVVHMAAGYPVEDQSLPAHLLDKLSVLVPVGATGERLARMCVLPLLLVGVLGSQSLPDTCLPDHLRELVLSTCLATGPWNDRDCPDLIDAVRFLCTQPVHHDRILAVLWELVVNPTPSVRITAAVLFQALSAYIDVTRLGTRVMPALVTLGTDASLDVKLASVAAMGAVALHCKEDAILDKVRVQMDSYLEEGAHEPAMAVLRALTAALPVTTPNLRNFLLQRVLPLTLAPPPSKLDRRQEKAAVLCAALKALNASDISGPGVQNYLVPSVQALLKDSIALSGADRDALEAILRDRGGKGLEAIGKAVGKSFFGEGGLFAKKEEGSQSAEALVSGGAEEKGFRRIMRLKYEEMLRGAKTSLGNQ